MTGFAKVPVVGMPGLVDVPAPAAPPGSPPAGDSFAITKSWPHTSQNRPDDGVPQSGHTADDDADGAGAAAAGGTLPPMGVPHSSQ
jgi:hypothetical protein